MDPRQELVERLLEYKMYKYVSFELRDKQMDANHLLFKDNTLPPEIANYKEDIDVSALLSDLTLAKLHTIFQSIMKKQIDKVDPIRSKFGRIEREEINLTQKILMIQEYGLANRTFSFRKLLEHQSNKEEVIVTFLGILELMKMQRIEIIQMDLFDDIMIRYLANDIAPVDEFSIE